MSEDGVGTTMELARFVADNPGCKVIRPDLVLPGLLAGVPAGGALIAGAAAIAATMSHSWLAALGWIALGAVLAAAVVRYGPRLRDVLALHRAGKASFAISDDDVLLIDAAGNAVVVALDRITGLEVDGLEVRLRTDSELQGIIYAILFQLFDDDIPGPSPEAFFEALAPRLRERAPHALIVHHQNESALA